MSDRHDIPDDVRRLLEEERRQAIRRANEIARMLGMRITEVVDRSKPAPRSAQAPAARQPD